MLTSTFAAKPARGASSTPLTTSTRPFRPRPSTPPDAEAKATARASDTHAASHSFGLVRVLGRGSEPPGGRPLPDSLRRTMEAAFSANFSKVRVRVDSRPESIGASAYTQGDTIHSGPGFRPDNHAGRELLAHELAHVVQQRSVRSTPTTWEALPVNDNPGLESEAEDVAARVARGERVEADSSKRSVGQAAQTPAVQANRKGGKRGKRKGFKNERSRRAAQKRGVGLEDEARPAWLKEGEELPSVGMPEPPEPVRERPRAKRSKPTKRERDLARQQRKASKRAARAAERDDSQMNFREPTGDSIRVYRPEVQKFSPQYSHVSTREGQATVYNPPPAASGRLPLSGARYVTQSGGYAHSSGRYIASKRTPVKGEDLRTYGKKFLRSREGHPQGTMSWINFGEPHRALEFYQQKSTNPTERAKGNVFAIKSFRVPSDIYRAIRDDTVHEREGRSKPTKAINVDRATPNQFGLQQHHLDLLNQTAIRGSARVEDPRKLARRTGYQFPKKERGPRQNAPKPSLKFGKAERNKLGPSLEDLEGAEEDARREMEEDAQRDMEEHEEDLEEG
ncbi:MAG: DUF4157 domain-containing protein [SAR202 cluster bacterium]|nr:DUF4157 domain-containing protein [SAR202 cluster bacterium]